jgi:hypothetical protein
MFVGKLERIMVRDRVACCGEPQFTKVDNRGTTQPCGEHEREYECDEVGSRR